MPARTRTGRVWIAPVVGVLVGAGIATAILAPHSSKLAGPGPMAVQTRTVPAFAGVDLTGANVVTISVGSPRAVEVRGHRELVENVTTRVSGGVLRIGTRGSSTARGSVHVTVGVPSLDALTLEGGGVIVATGVRAEHLAVNLPGSGVIRANGSANRLDVSLGGSGDVQLADLSARAVHAVLKGTGRIVVTPSRSLDASVPGTGTIIYRGNPPILRTSVTGSGVIQRG